jgi:hypothetical protein
VLSEAGLAVVAGTPLFRLVRAARAPQLFYRLGVSGILARHLPEQPGLLRFGLPSPEADWERLLAELLRCDDTAAAAVAGRGSTSLRRPNGPQGHCRGADLSCTAGDAAVS